MTRFSADLPQALRDILDGTPEGHLTPPEVTQEGVQMFALCTKKETTSDTPEKRKVKDQIFQQKFGSHAKRYLAAPGHDRVQAATAIATCVRWH